MQAHTMTITTNLLQKKGNIQFLQSQETDYVQKTKSNPNLTVYAFYRPFISTQTGYDPVFIMQILLRFQLHKEFECLRLSTVNTVSSLEKCGGGTGSR